MSTSITHSRRRAVRLAFAGLAVAVAASAPATGSAQTPAAWPTRPIKMIVPYAAGGFADIRARKLADKLSHSLGQPVVIDNRGGAGGVLGTDAIAKATDGHTFGFGSPGPLVTNPMLMKKMPYDAQRDLVPVVLIEEAPLFLTVSPGQPLQSVMDLVAAARTKPGTVTYGSSGVGGAHHLSGELLAYDTKTEMVHVPYKGGAPAAADLMGGHLTFMFEMGYSALPAIQAGKLRALAVSSERRVKVLPQVPTLQEAGIPGFASYNWLGMIAPAGTPPAVVQKLNAAVNAALKDPEVRAMIENSGGVVVGGTPQEYARFLDAERTQWAPVIRKANITLD